MADVGTEAMTLDDRSSCAKSAFQILSTTGCQLLWKIARATIARMCFDGVGARG